MATLIGNYYLCDNGYANSEGFLTPYKGVRYHLKEWGPATERPQNAAESFNMRHTRARNVIERAFAVLKMRWGILRNASFYPTKVQIRMIMACFLLHNYIRSVMVVDPIEALIDGVLDQGGGDEDNGVAEFVDGIEPTAAWNQRRDELAQAMWAHVSDLVTFDWLCNLYSYINEYFMSVFFSSDRTAVWGRDFDADISYMLL